MNIVSGMVAILLLAGCATTPPKAAEWMLVDGAWVQPAALAVARPEPWYRWLYCGAFGSTPCEGDKPAWAKALDVVNGAADTYTSTQQALEGIGRLK